MRVGVTGTKPPAVLVSTAATEEAVLPVAPVRPQDRPDRASARVVRKRSEARKDRLMAYLGQEDGPGRPRRRGRRQEYEMMVP
ncbi:hypothetical protein ASG74_07410 [Knoellia sp. Soil729]|nr:hypothetical protein ASG74_07410 [Knoellia sp. Soil729]